MRLPGHCTPRSSISSWPATRPSPRNWGWASTPPAVLHYSTQVQLQLDGHHHHHCKVSLYVFSRQAMLACVLPASKLEGARSVATKIMPLITRLHPVWPGTTSSSARTPTLAARA